MSAKPAGTVTVARVDGRDGHLGARTGERIRHRTAGGAHPGSGARGGHERPRRRVAWGREVLERRPQCGGSPQAPRLCHAGRVPKCPLHVVEPAGPDDRSGPRTVPWRGLGAADGLRPCHRVRGGDVRPARDPSGVFAPFGAATYSQLLGPRPAAELLFLGTPFDAQKAASVGIVNRVVREDELDATVALTAQTLCSHRGETLRLLKRVLRTSERDPWTPLARAESAYLEELMVPPEAEEGLRAFLEKRTPVWKDG